MESLQVQLKAVAMEYLRQVADLLDLNPRDCYWVGINDDNLGVYDIADFGGIYSLTFGEMQTIIHELDHWTNVYGSRQRVAEVVKEWCDWSVERYNHTNGHPKINLKSWLMGLRPEMIKEEEG